MKVLILGGVAAGTKAAAKLKREMPDAQVTILTRGKDISYAGCGLPYYVGGAIASRAALVVNSPEQFSGLTGAEVLTGREAFKVDPEARAVWARNLETGAEERYEYDELIIAVGASASVPPLEGVGLNGVFTMRTPDDAVAARDYIDQTGARRAVVIGGGFIGLELAENLKAKGLTVTVVEALPQIMSNVLDPEMADYARKQLVKAGIRVLTGTTASKFSGDEKVQSVATSAGVLPADVVVLSVGVKPNTAFLNGTGLEMNRGTILVDSRMRTNLAHIYAAGDCAQVTNRLTGAGQWSPMGSSANLEARVLAEDLAGGNKAFPGVLGTAVVKLLDNLNCGRTGLTEAAARQAGFDPVTALAVTDDKAHYYPGASTFVTKLIADRASRRLLGIQVFGAGAVDKMTDIAVTAISLKATVDDLESLDLAYAPPFSTAIHPFVQALGVLMNKMDGKMVSMTPAEYAAGKAKGYRVIDVAPQPNIPNATFVNLSAFNGEIEGVAKDEKLLLVCLKGKRGYMLQRKMAAAGYTNTAVLEGATFFNDVRVKLAGRVPAEEITRVKGLGFLMDKRTGETFNARVITRNGKITSAENRAISEAAELYGSGEVAMTSRLTVEIQGVPYENIEPLRAHLAQAGLQTGGTGSKVRPVVSCKGTTCQYGLIDTFSLADEIHERFYVGYHDVKLPHKFKIAVGGCPNNCVKPDLNDLGIIGQRVPEIQLDKCRGCKVCQVVNACPIKVAEMKDGKIHVDPEACNHCGRCVGKCPFHAFDESTNGYRICIGGRWGKKVARGRFLDKVFTDREEVLAVVEKAILLFREQGVTGERFADTVARLGFENVQAQLLADDLLARKEQNIHAQVHLTGGATC